MVAIVVNYCSHINGICYIGCVGIFTVNADLKRIIDEHAREKGLDPITDYTVFRGIVGYGEDEPVSQICEIRQNSP